MKWIITLFLLLGVFSCKKEEIPDTAKDPPCKIVSRQSTDGYVEVRILITDTFEGVIYVKNPTIYSHVKVYHPRIIDTVFTHPDITSKSIIAINYGWGQIEK